MSLYSSENAPSSFPNLFLNSIKYCLAFLSPEIVAINSLFTITFLLSSRPGFAVSYNFKTARISSWLYLRIFRLTKSFLKISYPLKYI